MRTLVSRFYRAFAAANGAVRYSFALILFTVWASTAFSATLVWDGNKDSFTVGYRVYVQTELETLQFDVGARTNLLLDFLKPGKTYFFEVVAYSDLGIESDHSGVLEYYVPIPFGWPTVLVQPVPVAVREGASAFLFAQASATGNLRYQWLKNGIELPGATSLFLSIPSITREAEGHYSVRISNDLGAVESNAALLSVLTPPEILSQSKTFSAIAGSPIFLSITARGTEPLEYTWFKDGVKLMNGISEILFIDGSTAADSGQYTVEVSNELGVVWSEPIEVTVKEPIPPVLVVERRGPVFVLELHGEPFSTYLIEMSFALVDGDWAFLTEVGTDASGNAEFELESAYGQMGLFRAIELPK